MEIVGRTTIHPLVNTPVNFVVQTNGKINGRMFSENGVPVAGITIDLLPVEQKDSTYPQGQRMQGSGKASNEWSPVYGIFTVPPGEMRMRFFLMPQ